MKSYCSLTYWRIHIGARLTPFCPLYVIPRRQFKSINAGVNLYVDVAYAWVDVDGAGFGVEKDKVLQL